MSSTIVQRVRFSVSSCTNIDFIELPISILESHRNIWYNRIFRLGIELNVRNRYRKCTNNFYHMLWIVVGIENNDAQSCGKCSPTACPVGNTLRVFPMRWSFRKTPTRPIRPYTPNLLFCDTINGAADIRIAGPIQPCRRP